MPVVSVHTGTRIQAQEYGTGIYGTVMPTNKPRLVVKITSDPAEARFAYILSNLPKSKYPPGLVRYHRVYQLQGTHENRPIFVLWREEAENVGAIRSDTETANYLYAIRDHADPSFRLTYDEEMRQSHVRPIAEADKKYRGKTGYEHRGKGPDIFKRAGLAISSEDTAAGFGVQAARAIADDMSHHNKEAPLVGAAIRDLIDNGVVLADVHPGNVGQVLRRGRWQNAITDPGNVAFLTRKYDNYYPPTVSEALEGLHGHKRMQRRGYRGFASERPHGRRMA